MEAFILIFSGVFVIGLIILVTLLLVVMRREKRAARNVTLASSGDEFWTSFHRYVDDYCSRRIRSQEAKPYAEYENASFFHHVYLPMQVVVAEKNSDAYRKQLKQLVIMLPACLIMIAVLFLLTQEALFLWFSVPLLLTLIVGVIIFLWLPGIWQQRMELLYGVDKKLMEVGNGTEPPPYRVPLQAVMQHQSV